MGACGGWRFRLAHRHCDTALQGVEGVDPAMLRRTCDGVWLWTSSGSGDYCAIQGKCGETGARSVGRHPGAALTSPSWHRPAKLHHLSTRPW